MTQLGNTETYAVKLAWKNTVFTADPEIVKEMLTTDHANYIKGKSLTDALQSVLGQGVFNTNGDLWRFHRSMSRPFFTREKLRAMMPVFTNHADRALDKWLSSSGGPTDVQDLASKFTLDAATEFLFGSCVHSLEEDLPTPWNVPSQVPTEKPGMTPPSPASAAAESLLPTNTRNVTNTGTRAFPTAFTSALQTLAARLRSGALWPLLEITKDSTRRDVNVIRDFVRSIVQRALERREERERAATGDATTPTTATASEDTGTTLLDHLVTVSDDTDLIQDELINILIAGRDTTASCITFALYLLTQHPSVLSKLSAEVHGVLGESHNNEEPDLDTLRQMPYLRAIINETLRLFPSVPMNVRDSVAERVITSSDGTRYYLPAGTGITYSQLHIHRSAKYWGPTASEFSPERFIAGGDGRYEAYYARTPFVFMPFNAGPRSCLGQQLAYAEVGVFLCRLVQRLRAKQGVGREHISLDQEAIPPACRVPSSWVEPEEKRVVEAGGLPLHVEEKAGAGAGSGSLPPYTSSGVSPRRRIEKVWPKSHLTMFVDGGVWVRV
ncbi:hypothetical protein M408DRAFT_231551 [Serendipita vermifera MAFF 305830]|uniref:Cytochrome P450 n=1 Tax=Serendipita vermifera MAFF 305830 TaxID=933852 RepID=A0A0C3AZG8_SERVB|nr:hypothetical protein M408DRAFT_231551 [Serendipita vermifera MAFF 305830]